MINQPWLAGEIPSKNEGLFLRKSSKSMVDFLARSSKSCCMSKGWPKCPKVYLRGTRLVLNKAKIERPNVHQTWID